MGQKTNRMPMSDRPIAITDIETTGLDPDTHEIIEIGLVLVDQKTLEILDTYEVKVRPEHLETAQPEALKVNGYDPADWQNAVPLAAAMAEYARRTRDAIFLAHNVSFDWPFVAKAFRKTGVRDEMSYHRLCNMSGARFLLHNKGLANFKQNQVAEFLGLEPEPEVHRALNGAMLAYQVFRILNGM
ncbi:MAG: 3'-5' exonuclease [Patescibacteria group bacterium]|jgi:DNA polymerase-3 subunit epsilon